MGVAMPGVREDAPQSTFRRYGISPLALRFESAAEEAKYQDFVLRSAVVHIRYAYAFAMVLAVAYVTLDPFLFSNPGLLRRAIYIRFAVLIPLLSAQISLTHWRRYTSHSQSIGVTVVVLFGLGITGLAFGANEAVIVDNYSSMIMTLIYAFFFTGLFFRFASMAGLAVVSLYLVAIFESPDTPVAIANSMETSLVVIFVIMGLCAYQKELISRQLYLTETRERERLSRQTQQDARHLEWLRTLARFLRHEVRQPVAQINSSIELAKLFDGGDGRGLEFLNGATLSTQHVWNLIERASRATDVEAYVRECRRQAIDLRTLLAKLVTDFKQTHSGLDFSLHCSLPVHVTDADPTLIDQAVRNLLANAASFAVEGSAVEIDLEQAGDSAIIRVRNRGPLAPDDAEPLFGPFSSTRTSPASEHHGLGLYLVRLVAEQHGGKASLRNLEDGSGVVASLTLPLRGA